MFEECLPSQSKDIPSMLVNMVLAATKKICKSDGEHVLELVNPCITNDNIKTQRCVRRLTARAQDYKRRKQYPSAQDVCEIFETFRPCVQSHLNAACGNHITREAFQQIYDESLSVCKTYKMNEVETVESVVV